MSNLEGVGSVLIVDKSLAADMERHLAEVLEAPGQGEADTIGMDSLRRRSLYSNPHCRYRRALRW
jgi:hypothetical protein